MRKENAQIKASARVILLGKYGPFSLFVLLSYLFQVLITLIPEWTFAQADTDLMIILKIVLLFLLSTLSNMLWIGLARISLCLCRNQEYGLSDLVYAFKNNSTQFLQVQLIFTAVQTALFVPFTYLDMTHAFEGYDTFVYYGIYLVWSLLALFVSLLIILRLSFAIYLLIEEPELTAGAALKKSIRLTKGAFGRLLYLKLSFIPMCILGICSFLIGFLYVKPYMEVSAVLQYMQIRSGKEEQNE